MDNCTEHYFSLIEQYSTDQNEDPEQALIFEVGYLKTIRKRMNGNIAAKLEAVDDLRIERSISEKKIREQEEQDPVNLATQMQAKQESLNRMDRRRGYASPD